MCVVISVVIPLLHVLVSTFTRSSFLFLLPIFPLSVLGGSGDETSRELYLGGRVACFSQLEK